MKKNKITKAKMLYNSSRNLTLSISVHENAICCSVRGPVTINQKNYSLIAKSQNFTCMLVILNHKSELYAHIYKWLLIQGSFLSLNK